MPEDKPQVVEWQRARSVTTYQRPAQSRSTDAHPQKQNPRRFTERGSNEKPWQTL